MASRKPDYLVTEYTIVTVEPATKQKEKDNGAFGLLAVVIFVFVVISLLSGGGSEPTVTIPGTIVPTPADETPASR